MERIVIRPARASDAAELARNWIEVAQRYVELDPQAFRVPSTDGLVAFFAESLERPRSGDSVWLVAEVDGQVVGDVSARLERPAEDAERQVLSARCCATWGKSGSTLMCSAWRRRTGAEVSARG